MCWKSPQVKTLHWWSWHPVGLLLCYSATVLLTGLPNSYEMVTYGNNPFRTEETCVMAEQWMSLWCYVWSYLGYTVVGEGKGGEALGQSNLQRCKKSFNQQLHTTGKVHYFTPPPISALNSLSSLWERCCYGCSPASSAGASSPEVGHSVLQELEQCAALARAVCSRSYSSMLQELQQCFAGATAVCCRSYSSVLQELQQCFAGATAVCCRSYSSVLQDLQQCSAGATTVCCRIYSSAVGDTSVL